MCARNSVRGSLKKPKLTKNKRKGSKGGQQTDPDQLELMFRQLEMMLVDGGEDVAFV